MHGFQPCHTVPGLICSLKPRSKIPRPPQSFIFYACKTNATWTMLPSSSDSSSCNTASLYHSCPGLHVLTLGKHCPGLLPWRNNNPILHLLPPDEFGPSHYGGSGGWGFNSPLTRCGTGFSSVVLIFLTGRAAFSAQNPVPSYLEISSDEQISPLP